MKKFIISAFCLTFALCFVSCEESNPKSDPITLTRSQETIVSNLTEFSWNLLRDVHKMDFEKTHVESNTLISPFSAAATLGMAANASNNETKAKLTELLGFDANDLSVFDELVLNVISQFPNYDKKVNFATANSTWLLQSYLIAPEDYKSVLKTFYNAAVQTTTNNSLNSAVNSWASNALGSDFGSIDMTVKPSSQVLWMNLMKFEGEWTIAFDKSNTEEEYFTNFIGNKKKVNMMNKYGKFKRFCKFIGKQDDGSFSTDKEYAGVTLEYGNGSFGFTAIIPMGGRDLKWLLDNLTSESIEEALKRRESSTLIKLKLPKFEVSNHVDITGSVNNLLGENLLDEIEFPKLNSQAGPLNIQQNLCLKVDEDGTKVTVKTKSEHGLTSVGIDHLYFDEPFVYFIHDLDHGIVLAAGIYGK